LVLEFGVVGEDLDSYDLVWPLGAKTDLAARVSAWHAVYQQSVFQKKMESLHTGIEGSNPNQVHKLQEENCAFILEGKASQAIYGKSARQMDFWHQGHQQGGSVHVVVCKKCD
jgi:hypothetical protein